MICLTLIDFYPKREIHYIDPHPPQKLQKFEVQVKIIIFAKMFESTWLNFLICILQMLVKFKLLLKITSILFQKHQVTKHYYAF